MDAVTQPPKVHDHHEAELLIPLGFLSFTIITGLYRYFFVLRVRSYYRPLLSDSNVETDDTTEAETLNGRRQQHHNQRVTTLGRTIYILNHVILLTYIAGLTVISSLGSGTELSSFWPCSHKSTASESLGKMT
ncbi:MAG: hypothetical protein JOS17DRAFT_339585 [Linnemannia elongata]|nr:MAG: hypothetical protein JOS17DRAFT_339585 [Linnemannia elongata]